MSEQEIQQTTEDKDLISKDGLNAIKTETWNLILRFHTVTKISGRTCKLYLDKSAPIKFTKFEPIDILRFHFLVKKFFQAVTPLIQNLSYESDTQRVERENVTGSIDFEKTRILRQTGSTNVVCIEHSKNLFTHENVLLAAAILGIEEMARIFLKKRAHWEEKAGKMKPYKMTGQVEMLESVINYAHFLQKDRLVSKLVRYYLQNFQGIEYLLKETLYRINLGKVDQKYRWLLEFIKIWKQYDQILNEDNHSLPAELSSLYEWKKPAYVYQMWIFYKIVESVFENTGVKLVKQMGKTKKFSDGKYTVEYQFHKHISWRMMGKRDGLDRYPDTIIKKGSRIVAMIDAKYMYSEVSTPTTDIVSQMIIEMVYGEEDDNTDIGIVLFADKRKLKPIVIEKIKGSEKIHFMNMHPENSWEVTLEKVKNIIGVGN